MDEKTLCTSINCEHCHFDMDGTVCSPGVPVPSLDNAPLKECEDCGQIPV